MTSHSHHPDEEQLVLFFYGEAEGAGEVGAHLETCAACRANLRTLERTLATVDAHRIPERGDGYPAQVWARLQDRLVRPASSRWFTWFTPGRLILAGSVAVLLVAAFVAGRYTSTPRPTQVAGGPAVATKAQSPASGPQVRDRVLLVAVGDHLERSQMVLIELINRPANGPVDISSAQEWARDLVPTNRLIRQTADAAGEPVVADVLDDLERTLIEIANSPSELSSAEFERVRQRIESQGLVFKIRVLDSEVRQREAAPAPRAARTRL